MNLANSDMNQPDILLLFVFLPNMDNLSLDRLLKQSISTGNIKKSIEYAAVFKIKFAIQGWIIYRW